MVIQGDVVQRKIIAYSALSVFLVAGCSVGQGPGQVQGSEDVSVPTEPAGVKVDSPKDPAALAPCSLLPAQGAQSLGLSAEGRPTDSPYGGGKDDGCEWDNEDGSIASSLTVLSDRTLQDYYDNSAQYVDYGELSIAGHPAVRANDNDPKADGICVNFLASKPDQVVFAYATVPSSEVGAVDPCDLAKKTLEVAVPSWPAAN